jgi:hypothetical protein
MSFQQYNVYAGLTPVNVAATSNLSGTYYNGSVNNGVGATLTLATGALTVDGVSVIAGDRLILVSQTSTNQNGIYICTQTGATGVSAILQRSADMQCNEQLLLGQYVSVGEGSSWGGSIFVLTTLPAQLGIDAFIIYHDSR